MFEILVVWFVTIISLIVVVKRVEKPSTSLAEGIHKNKTTLWVRDFIYNKKKEQEICQKHTQISK